MTTIKDFTNVRLGSGFPNVIDVCPIYLHESYGVIASTFLYTDYYKNKEVPRKVEVRLNEKLKTIAIFSYKYEDMEVPEDWKDSEIIWARHIKEVK